jgi:hypothetical protein
VTRRSTHGLPYAIELGNNIWAIGNDLIEQRIAFINDGLFSVLLQHKLSGRNWSALASPLFFLKEDDADLTAANNWTFIEFEASASDAEAHLRVTVQHTLRAIRIHAHLHVWPDAPIVRSWNEYENMDAALSHRLQTQSFCNLRTAAVGDLQAVWVTPFSWLWQHTDASFVAQRKSLGNDQSQHLLIGPYAAGDVIAYSPTTHKHACGWFAFHRPGLEAGLFCGIEWSGACEARLALNGAGEGELSVSHWQPGFTHRVDPRERVVSPVAFIGLFEGALDEATHLTRELAAQRYIPPKPGIDVLAGVESPYVIANTWGYGSDIEEVGLRTFIDRAAAIGVEVVTIDEGWETRIGEWTSHPARFPSGVRATVDSIHGKGMAAGLWLAFGNVDPASPIAQAHPDWLATLNGAPIDGSFGSQVLCLSHAPAREWVASEIDRLIEEFDIDRIEQDFETIARCNNPAHAHQTGDGEYRNVYALWELIDGVRARHPDVEIQNNWSGGRVMDFGMLRRYDATLCDDYNRAGRNRIAAYGATHFFPAGYIAKYMGDEPLSFDYQTRSYFLGGPWNLMVDLIGHDPTALRNAVDAFKALRSLTRNWRVYHIDSPSLNGSGWNAVPVTWDAIEVAETRVNAARAVILIGRGWGGGPTFRIYPRGLDPTILYDVLSLRGGTYGRRLGSDLMSNGLEVALPERAHETILLTRLTHSIFLPALNRQA